MLRKSSAGFLAPVLVALILAGGVGITGPQPVRAQDEPVEQFGTLELSGTTERGATGYLIEIGNAGQTGYTVLATFQASRFGGDMEYGAHFLVPANWSNGQRNIFVDTGSEQAPEHVYQASGGYHSDFLLSARNGDQTMYVNPDDDGTYRKFPLGHPSYSPGIIEATAGYYWWIFVATVGTEFDVSLENSRLIDGPVHVDGVQRYVYSEQNFDTTTTVASRPRVASVMVSDGGQLEFHTNEWTYMMIQVQDDSEALDYSLTDPAGAEVPFEKRWTLGRGAGAGPFFVGGRADLNQVDLLSDKSGTWRMEVGQVVSREFDVYAYIFDLRAFPETTA